MFTSARKRPLASTVFVAVITALSGCNDGTTTTQTASEPAPPAAGPVTVASYSGPGSNWSHALNDDGTFEVARSPAVGLPNDLTVSGSYEETATGFLQMTIDAASGSDAPGAGTSLWALEVPNHVLFLSPVSLNDNYMIPMVQGGECAGSDMAGNWITVRSRPSADVTLEGDGFFGTFDYTFSNGSTTVSGSHLLADGFPGQDAISLGNGFCQDGVVSTQDSDIYLSGTGSAVANAHATDEDGGYIALALPKSTIGSISDYDGSYIGVLSDDGADADQRVLPVSVTCAGGICSGDVVTDFATGDTAGQPFTADLFGSINEPAVGFATGTFSMGGGSGNLACMVDDNVMDSGQRMISCAGQSPTRDYRLLNLILASTD